jgi:hypothetical protein
MKQVGKKTLIKSLIINSLIFYFLPIYLPLHALVSLLMQDITLLTTAKNTRTFAAIIPIHTTFLRIQTPLSCLTISWDLPVSQSLAKSPPLSKKAVFDSILSQKWLFY